MKKGDEKKDEKRVGKKGCEKGCERKRARSAHATFSRVWLKKGLRRIVSIFETNVHRSRAPCLTRTLCGLTSHHFLFLSTFLLFLIHLTLTNNHSIHGHKDGLVAWPYKVVLQVVSPTPLSSSAVQRLLLCKKMGDEKKE